MGDPHFKHIFESVSFPAKNIFIKIIWQRAIIWTIDDTVRSYTHCVCQSSYQKIDSKAV